MYYIVISTIFLIFYHLIISAGRKVTVACNSKYSSQNMILVSKHDFFEFMFSIFELLLRNYQIQKLSRKICVNKANNISQMLLPINKMFLFSGMI